jgi:hypothetical protein
MRLAKRVAHERATPSNWSTAGDEVKSPERARTALAGNTEHAVGSGAGL